MNSVYASFSVIALFGIYLCHVVSLIVQRISWQWWYRNIYLHSPHWSFTRWWKKLVFFITHGAVYCEKCGSERRLQIHHIHYRHIGHERLYDLQIICKLCHRKGSGRI